jgi:hypothetical protein
MAAQNSPFFPVAVNEKAVNDPVKRYALYHKELDDFAEKKKLNQDKLDQMARAQKPNPSPRVLNNIINSNNSNRNNHKPVIKGSPLVNDFVKRKEEFARNKARGKGLFNPLVPKPPQVRRDENSDYEEKLRRIRLKNYNNRRLLLNQDKKKSIDLSMENNIRLKRIAALKQQSEEQAQRMLKERLELEKRRQVAFEKERLFNENKKAEQRPAPAVNITEVFDAIGVVGKQISKAEVLRNLNEKLALQIQYDKIAGSGDSAQVKNCLLY